jgi:hypothetical protein
MSINSRMVFVCFIAAMLSMMSSWAETAKPVNVCELLSNIDRYQGKQVTVRGVFDWSRHGWILMDNPDWRHCPAVEKQGHTWPPAIELRRFIKGSQLEDGPASFETDAQVEEILSKPQHIVKEQIEKGGEQLSIIATFTGELRSQKNMRIVGTKDDSYYGFGYGQAGQFPAQLVIKSVRDVKVVKQGKQN